MGNVNAKKEEETIDGGGFQLHGIYSGPQDFDHKVVKKLIQMRRLAAFYKGLPDLELLGKRSIGNSLQENSKRRSSSVRSRHSSAKLTMADLYRGAVECPICFLYYPRNINYSRCCEQPMCTECFVQIKRPEATEILYIYYAIYRCPFCVRPHFGVLYKPPKDVTFYLNGPNEIHDTSHNISTDLRPTMTDQCDSADSSKDDNRKKTVDYKHPDVVTSDDIRPAFLHLLEIQSHTIANAARLLSGETTSGPQPLTVVPTSSDISRSSRRRDHNTYLNHLGGDLEEMMIMEAIRQSIIEEQEREERERHDKHAERQVQERFQRRGLTNNTVGTTEYEQPCVDGNIEARLTNLGISGTEFLSSEDNITEQQKVFEDGSQEDLHIEPNLQGSICSNKNDMCEA